MLEFPYMTLPGGITRPIIAVVVGSTFHGPQKKITLDSQPNLPIV
jgi:hypothetical protein